MIRFSHRLASATAVALSAFCATSASAAIVTSSFAINSALLVDLYSATFDGALIPCGPTPTQECTFFSGSTPAPRAIVVTQTGTSTGTLDVDWESTTGEILEVNAMEILLPRMDLVISGATFIVADPADLTAPGLNFIRSGTLGLPQATVDPDEGVAIGQAGIFQHDDAPNPSAPDFATFSTIVDSCSGPLCALIGILSLDGVRYRLEGSVNGAGGDSLVLKAQTANNSIYRIDFTTAVVPAPAAGWLLLPAIGAIAARARRRRAA